MKTLLRVPDLVEAVAQLVEFDVSINDMFKLIGDGKIKPYGYVQRAPIFEPGQIAGEFANAT